MAKVKISDYRNLSLEELKDKLDKTKKQLMDYRFQLKTGKLEKQTVIRNTRKDIARIMTVMSELKNQEKVEAAS